MNFNALFQPHIYLYISEIYLRSRLQIRSCRLRAKIASPPIDQARGRLEQTLQVHDVAHVRSAFDYLILQVTRLGADVSHTAASVTRTQINADLVEAAVELARLRALVVRRVAEVDQTRQKAIDKDPESSLVWLGGPLAKFIQEAVSMAKGRTLSEHVSINAIRDPERAQADAGVSSPASLA